MSPTAECTSLCLLLPFTYYPLLFQQSLGIYGKDRFGLFVKQLFQVFADLYVIIPGKIGVEDHFSKADFFDESQEQFVFNVSK